MATDTGIEIPAFLLNPYYTAFVSMCGQIDQRLLAALQDKDVILSGGGDIVLQGNDISWSENIMLISPKLGSVIIVSAGSLELADGEIMVVEVSSRPFTGIAMLTPSAVSSIAVDDHNTIPICIRAGDEVLFQSRFVAVEETVFIPVDEGLDNTDPPAAAEMVIDGNGVLRVRKFIGVADERLTFSWTAPPDLVAATGVRFNVEGVLTEVIVPDSEEVSFKIGGYSIGDGDPLDNTISDLISSEKTFGPEVTNLQYNVFVTAPSEKVTVTDIAAGEKVMLRLTRDTSDPNNYTQDVGVTGVRLTYFRRPRFATPYLEPEI